MRITDLRAAPVAVPYRPDEVWAFGRRRGQVSVLLEVHTDEGLVGLGEAAAYPSAGIVLAVLDSLRPLVLGADPVRIERLVRRIELVGTWHHVKAASPAIAAVEMACWDILGKVCGQPLVNLLGGRFHDRVEFFYYVARDKPDEVAAEGKRAADAGFSTCYLKVGPDDPRRDVERVAALRDGAGPEMALRVDANEAWSAGAAVRMIAELARYDLEFVEQPVSGRNLAEMAYVRSRMDVPLLATAVHAIAATPNFRYANQGYGALLADDVTVGFGGGIESYVDGTLEPPAGPGLGVRLDEDKVAKYAELYRTTGAEFAFHDGDVLTTAPALPKR